MTTHNIRRGSPVVVLIVGLMAMALSCGGSAAETTADSSSSDQSASGQGRLLGLGSAGAEEPAGALGPSDDRALRAVQQSAPAATRAPAAAAAPTAGAHVWGTGRSLGVRLARRTSLTANSSWNLGSALK